MALWAGTSLNTNALAKLFNHVHTSRSVAMVAKATPLLNSFMGRGEKDGNSAYNKQVGGWMKTKSITGDKHEISLLGALDTPASIADGTAELTAASIAYNAAAHGAAEFILAHYGLVKGMPSSEYMRIRGSDAKTTSWAAEFYETLSLSYDDILSAELHENSTSAPPARSQFGSWVTAVDDGNTYGTIDRSDAANIDFRSYVTSAGALTVPKVQASINKVRTNRGKTKVGVMGLTIFNGWQQLIQPYSQATYSASTAQWGSDHVMFAGVDWVLDPDCPDGLVGGFDPSEWLVINNDYPFTDGGLVKEPTLNAGYIMNTEIWIQNICKKPNSQWKMEDVTV